MSSLFIHPVNPNYLPENDRLLFNTLHALELIGEPLDLPETDAYQLGERLFQLISFMGCAPSFKFEPDGPEDEVFCHVRLHQTPQPQFYYLRAERPARCPACRKPGIQSAGFASLAYSEQQHWLCPACGVESPAGTLDWRREAGMACLLLEVREIYPHEGNPTDVLLNGLKSATGQEWSWFYA